MSGVCEHYRVSTLGQELRDCLDELVESGELRADRSDVIFAQFDKAICAALAADVKSKASIRGPMVYYKNHDDIWTVRARLRARPSLRPSDAKRCEAIVADCACMAGAPFLFFLGRSLCSSP